MKKLLIVMTILLVLAGCQERKTIDYQQPSGTASDMSGYGIESGDFYDLTIKELLGFFAEGKTTIVYIGRDNCEWCLDLIPVLDEIIREKDMKVWYLDILKQSEDDLKHIDEVAELCREFVEIDSEGKPILRAPSVLYIQEGKLIDLHEGTVNTHDATEREMTQKELERLRYNLRKEFDSLLVRK